MAIDISATDAMVVLHIWTNILHSPLNVGCIVDMLGTSVPGINMHSMFMCLICVHLAPQVYLMQPDIHINRTRYNGDSNLKPFLPREVDLDA